MSIAFQVDAFQDSYPSLDAAFQSFDNFIEVDLLSIDNLLLMEIGPMALYKQGAVVVVNVTIKDPSQLPHMPIDADTAKITIYNPDDTIKVNAADLSRVTTGTYKYIAQTDGTWALGAYSGTIAATSGAYTDKTIIQEFFRLVA